MAVSMRAVVLAAVRLLIVALLGSHVGAAQPDLCGAGADCRTLGNDHVLLQARVAELNRAESRAECRILTRGDTCFQHVRWAMERGIRQNPEAYPGLTPESTFDEFQAMLHEDGPHDCPRPCPCNTVGDGHQCYRHVRWAMQHGIRLHPEWYTGLTNASSFKEFQAHLHRGAHWGCPQPCDHDDEVTTTTATTTVTGPPPSMWRCKAGCGGSDRGCYMRCEFENCPGMRECYEECWEFSQGDCAYQCRYHNFPCYP